MSECIHGFSLWNEHCNQCFPVAEVSDRKHKNHCAKHNVAYEDQCGMCVDFPEVHEEEEPQNSQLNELISNILKTQAVTVQMVADIIDKVNKLEFAIKELREKQ